ncbi:MAG: alkane 1-monooxygenase [Pseudomonadota bacterium]
MNDSPNTPSRLDPAWPFWVSLLLVPLILFVAAQGGLWLFLVPISTWWLFIGLDAATAANTNNADPETAEDALGAYKALTLLWVPLQFGVILGLIWYATRAAHLDTIEKIGLFCGVGILSGTIGINYAHELMHQRNRLERWAADLLLASVLYSHFRSEHLLVHHRYIGTPKDPVTARYNEAFWRFFPRVLIACALSSFAAEAALLARKNRPWWDWANPFWRYAGLQTVCVVAALALGGWAGLGLFAVQAVVAIWQLELVNYVEHYGLTRRHLGAGRYEHVQPHHSWNSTERASNWLLINLQRHSDHHYKPDRRFPLLQSRVGEAPELPAGYPVMTLAALVSPIWRRIMNPRVRAWRRQHYADIEDWSAYNAASNPLPR